MKPTAGLLCSSLLIVLALACTAQGAGYSLTWEAKGSTFFDKFNFITYNDPSLGFVNYVNRTYAQGTHPNIST
jgi:hypothetical protein